jgi:hypothetical protein
MLPGIVDLVELVVIPGGVATVTIELAGFITGRVEPAGTKDDL